MYICIRILQAAQSRHNISYWKGDQYIGIGPGAHGRFVARDNGGTRREARIQTLEPEPWMREVEAQGHATRKATPLSPHEVYVYFYNSATLCWFFCFFSLCS